MHQGAGPSGRHQESGCLGECPRRPWRARGFSAFSYRSTPLRSCRRSPPAGSKQVFASTSRRRTPASRRKGMVNGRSRPPLPSPHADRTRNFVPQLQNPCGAFPARTVSNSDRRTRLYPPTVASPTLPRVPAAVPPARERIPSHETHTDGRPEAPEPRHTRDHAIQSQQEPHHPSPRQYDWPQGEPGQSARATRTTPALG